MVQQYSVDSENNITIYSHAAKEFSNTDISVGNCLALKTNSTLSLFCITGLDAGLVIPISRPLTIGRSSLCEVQIADPHTPRLTLAITTENSRYYFETLSSTITVKSAFNSYQNSFTTSIKYLLIHNIIFKIGANTFYTQNSWHNIQFETLPPSQNKNTGSKNSRFIYALATLTTAIITALLFRSVALLIFGLATLLTSSLIFFYEKYQKNKATKNQNNKVSYYKPLDLFQRKAIFPKTAIAYGDNAVQTLTIPAECTTLFLDARLPNLSGILRWLILTWVAQRNSKVHIHGIIFPWLALCYQNNSYLQKCLVLCPNKECATNAPSIDIGNYCNTTSNVKYFCIPITLNVKDTVACNLGYFLWFITKQLPPQLSQSSYQDKIAHKKPWHFFLECELETGEDIWLDINKAGPHFAIAGTTGAGKSELLTAALLSLCLSDEPTELALFICDFKGGTSLQLLEKLPHTVFALSNQNLLEAKRALTLLAAEITRREILFTNNHVKNVKEYRQVNFNDPMPNLIIVIDEFRILAEELPNDLAILVRSVSVGRSLGINVIFASQNMQGILDAAIRFNIGSFISLKAKNIQDSLDIIQTADAANIANPGHEILVDNFGDKKSFQTSLVDQEYPANINLENFISYGSLKTLIKAKQSNYLESQKSI
ncbi:MAG: FtsK/SpoIIIE domain-containing protein [Micrococcaceae bacterium]